MSDVTPQAEARERLLYEISDRERRDLLDWIATLEIPVALQKVLAKGTDLEAVVDAYCPNCDQRVRVRYPDWKGMKGFVELLFQYKLQKPSELRQVDINVRVAHTREQLEQLTDAELLEIAGVEDAEWRQLPSGVTDGRAS